MKLHIPLSLRAAILGAMTLAFATPTYAKDYNLGTSTAPVTDHGLDTTKDVAISSGDRVGYIDTDNKLYGIDEGYTNSLKSSDLSISGNLYINGGQLSIGGTTNGSSLNGAKLTVKGTVTVDSGTLSATITNLGSLTINGGNVVLHDCKSGGTEPFAQGNSMTNGAKQAHISGLTTINGGTLIGGVSGGAYITSGGHSYQCVTSFGGGIKKAFNQRHTLSYFALSRLAS